MIRLALLILANVAGSAFCSLSEAALLASSEARIRALVQAGNRRAQRLLPIRQDPGKTLAAIVFMNNLFAIAGTAFITAEATKVIDSATGMFAIIAVQTLVIIAFGEILPKVLGEAHPERISLLTAPVLVGVRRVLMPLVWAVNHLIAWARPARQGARGEETEIRQLALMGREGGLIAPEEVDLIHRVFRLDDITAEDVMTPRALVHGFSADAVLGDLQKSLLTANHSQFPVYEEDLDKVVGVLWLRDALGALARGDGHLRMRDVMRPPMFVPQSRTVDDVLRDLQARHKRMAIVIDEYGVTLGIITMDDLVEELVGEAIDETDVSEGLVKRISRHAALVHGLTRISDVARLLKCRLDPVSPEDETNTVTGLLQERLERIPQAGDVLEVPGGLTLEVRVADGRMAVRVLATSTRRRGQAAH